MNRTTHNINVSNKFINFLTAKFLHIFTVFSLKVILKKELLDHFQNRYLALRTRLLGPFVNINNYISFTNKMLVYYKITNIDLFKERSSNSLCIPKTVYIYYIETSQSVTNGLTHTWTYELYVHDIQVVNTKF